MFVLDVGGVRRGPARSPPQEMKGLQLEVGERRRIWLLVRASFSPGSQGGSTPVMSTDIGSLMSEGAEALGLSLSGDEVASLADYAVELRRWSSRVSLTSVEDERGIVASHFLDSLAAFREIGRVVTVAPQGNEASAPVSILSAGGQAPGHGRAGCDVVDVGSGAGFPGMVIGITRPDLGVTLVEANQKKAAFLHHIRRSLGLGNVRVERGRAEVLAKGHLCSRFSLATVRAVAHPGLAVAYCLPFLRIGGVAAALCGWSAEVELEPVADAAGARLFAVREGGASAGRAPLLVAELCGAPTYDLPWGYGLRKVMILRRVTPA